MSYQVRHKEFGLFQGMCLGMGFWYPMSDMPEQGICEFPTRQNALEFIDCCCSLEAEGRLNRADFSIEPFDVELDKELEFVRASMKLEEN